MRAVLLGKGSPPPNPKRRGPATLLSLGDARFLVDAGSGVGAQLVQAGVRPMERLLVFITHHHSDHTIDLGHLLISRWIAGQNTPFEIWGPTGSVPAELEATARRDFAGAIVVGEDLAEV